MIILKLAKLLKLTDVYASIDIHDDNDENKIVVKDKCACDIRTNPEYAGYLTRKVGYIHPYGENRIKIYVK